MISDMATRVTARIAPYIEAIKKAREAGLTWSDIASVMGIENPDRVRWAVGHCRYQVEQMPLPEPKTKPKPEVKTAPQENAQGSLSRETDIDAVINKHLIK